MKKSSQKVNEIRKRKKQEFVDRLGGKCQICGYDRCISSLTFHHIDSKQKDSTISKLIANSSYEKIEKEIEKCILLCANCHGEIHHSDIDFSIKLKPIAWFEFECQSCGKKFKTTNIEQKFCKDKCRIVGVSKVENRPTKEELKLMLSKNTYTAIAKIYGVSDNSIRKWAKKYKLL